MDIGNNATQCLEMQWWIEWTKSKISVNTLDLTIDSNTAWA